LTFDTNNRINNGAQTYDTAGNVMQDSTHHYYYDAENHLLQVDGTLGTCSTATACYVYDANGLRVEKTAAGASLYFLYDLAGHPFTEINSSGNWDRTEIYAEGRHLATYSSGASGSTDFNHGDWLGTERARTGISGSVCETITSLAFGDGLTTAGSCGDPSPLHFTGKQRDSESGLDYFGARYYGSSMGRFMSPDWDSTPQAVPYATLADPQTLNLYSYVVSNPLSKADPNGHDWFNVDGKWQWQKGHVYHDADGNATSAKGYAGLLVVTATGTNKQGATTYSLTLYDQNKVVAQGTGFSGSTHYADTGAIRIGNYRILGRFDAPPTAPNPASADHNPPPVFGYQRIDRTINPYADAVYQAYGPMRARLNPLDPDTKDEGVYFHGQFGDAFHSQGWTHGCLSYGQDTTMIDYMASHFGNAWTGVSVDTPVAKPQ
jgi:RHS repeat-associated protein